MLFFACCLGGSLKAQTTDVDTDQVGGATITGPQNYTSGSEVKNIIGAGTLTINGSGTVTMSDTFGFTNFNMTGGQIIIQSGVTLRNGGFGRANWTNNLASMNVAGGGRI